MTRLIANNISTTLDGAITNVATTMTLTSVTGFPAVGSGDTTQVTISDGTNTEIVTATAISGSVITITRGQEGTSGTAFADDDTVEIRLTALSLTDVLGADLTPKLAGPLDISSDFISFGGSSTTTAFNINSTGGVPVLQGPANFRWTFSGSKLYCQAGTSFNSITFANDSTRLVIKTNNSERMAVIDAGVKISNGTLDMNTNNIIIDDAKGIIDGNSNEQLIFQQTTSAVNYIEMTNAATTGSPTISVAGSDSVINLDLKPKSTGGVRTFSATNTIGRDIMSGYVSLSFISDDGASSRFGSISKNYDSPFEMTINAATAATAVPLIIKGGSATEYARFDASGNLGIGTGTPGAKLDVTGDIEASTWVKVGSYVVSSLPSASTAGAGAMIFVTDETGGAVVAFSDATNWRRVTDRAVVA